MAQSEPSNEDDEITLSDMFDDAFTLYEKIMISDSASNNPKLQMDIKYCINLLEKATHLINVAGVFSENETIHEVPSSNIKYFLIPAMLGILVLKVQSQDRVNALETAEVYFKDYLKRIHEYEITSVNYSEQMYETENENLPRRLDLEQLAKERNEKIKRYKEQKETEAEIQQLKGLLFNCDDEIYRRYYLIHAKNFVRISLDELKLLKQEKPLAKHLAETRTSGTSFSTEQEKDKFPVKSFTPIIITRNEVQKKVFGAGYPSLPTMTVDEFYRERVAEGIFPANCSSNGRIIQEYTNPEVVQERDEEEEIKKEKEIETDDAAYLEKTRNMDEFKDTHKRGWGNRMNRS